MPTLRRRQTSSGCLWSSILLGRILTDIGFPGGMGLCRRRWDTMPIPILGFLPGVVPALDENTASQNFELADNAIEQGRLAAAGWAEQDDGSALCNIGIERLQYGYRTET